MNPARHFELDTDGAVRDPAMNMPLDPHRRGAESDPRAAWLWLRVNRQGISIEPEFFRR